MNIIKTIIIILASLGWFLTAYDAIRGKEHRIAYAGACTIIAIYILSEFFK